MAFGWFRRRQKLILIVMAFLMVSFLIGFQGFDAFIQSNPGKEKEGVYRDGTLIRGDLFAARNDIEMLRSLAGVIARSDQLQLEELKMLVGQKESASDLAFALLLKEAKQNGINISDQDVTDFFAVAGLTDQKYKDQINQFINARRGTEKQIRSAIADWLTIHRNYQIHGAIVPPSSNQLIRNFEDLAHTITVRAVRLPVSQFIPELQASMPSSSQLASMFDKYKGISAGDFSDRSPLGFGYMQPPRVAISCLLINRQAIARVIRPDNNQLMDYYNDPSHAEEFMVSVPTSQPSPAGTQAPEIKRKQEFAEAQPAIVKKLTESDVNRRLDAIVAKVQDKIRQSQLKSSELNLDPYPDVVKSMMSQADDVLDKPLGMVVFASQPLEEIVSSLAAKAGLDAICYPWGKQGPNTLDPQVRLSMGPQNRTLRQALAEVDTQIRSRMISDWPQLQWAKFEMIEKAIFPVAAQAQTGPAATQPAEIVEMFPVRSLQAGLMDVHEMSRSEVFGSTRDPVNQDVTLADYAFGGKSIGGDEDRKMPPVEVGKEGPIMAFGFQETSGSMFWRVTRRQAAHVPTEIDPAIQLQIERDIRIEQAFDLAKVKAQQISQSGNLQPEGFQSVLVGPFARKSFGGEPEIFELGCENTASKNLFVERVFALTKGQADFGKTIVVPLPADRMVVVAAMADETQATAKEYMTDADGTIVAKFKADKPGISTITGLISFEGMQSMLKNEKAGLYTLTVDVRQGASATNRVFDMDYNNSTVSVAPEQIFQIRADCDQRIWQWQMQRRQNLFHASDPCVRQVAWPEYIPGKKTLAVYETQMRQLMNMSQWFSVAGVSSRMDYKPGK